MNSNITFRNVRHHRTERRHQPPQATHARVDAEFACRRKHRGFSTACRMFVGMHIAPHRYRVAHLNMCVDQTSAATSEICHFGVLSDIWVAVAHGTSLTNSKTQRAGLTGGGGGAGEGVADGAAERLARLRRHERPPPIAVCQAIEGRRHVQLAIRVPAHGDQPFSRRAKFHLASSDMIYGV